MVTHDGNLGPDGKGSKYNCDSSVKYPNDKTDDDSNSSDLAYGTTLEEKFQSAAFLRQD